uniref:Tr-type G domain-containing protein n=1 Tax=Alexandrium catenella TaxID=2925 RepID=A0A7S1LFB6_ALECA|eukprot:CAMPEP_0171207000 /NCGR_PEP_ID=MMETSP0790-20130122/27350_1 /TAXON_ID=2925 /ORGANISM="Alexandrium catenella, Strain OF101" /LENGTH=615 /DNA_ID=CAMNT_0011672557 /DNA_START=13 /DNA_END=1860 /DNA_ORIENTATION=+
MERQLSKVEEGVYQRDDIRNLAIIAHVDHGKTTLTDTLMKQCGKESKTSMDSNQLEMERGITILAKNAAIMYKGVKINLIDTPGHADFGGEVERILNMADGCLLLVDAQEGPMPQTKFVLRKALDLCKKTMVVINKVDKPASRPDWVLDTTFDLFAALGADDELCDFPVCYASGMQGKAALDSPDKLADNLIPLLDQILEECPKPRFKEDEPLQMLVANLDYNDYVGRISIGRLSGGSLKVGQQVGFKYGPDGELRKANVSKLWCFDNNERVEVEEIHAGDICAFSGMGDVVIGDTVVDLEDARALPPIKVEEPTVAMEFGVNRSPYAGRDKAAARLTGTELGKRLEKECLTNLAVRMEPGGTSESFRVKGRGTLQLGILMENMRREGYEVMVGAPEVLYREDPETGKKQEPYEEAAVEVGADIQGSVLEEFNKKGAVMKSMEVGSVENSTVMTFEIPTANLIGMQGKLMTKTRGQAVLTSRFSHWGEAQTGSASKLREKGSIVNTATGKATTYALENISARGSTFIAPGDEVYEGMCIGIHNKEQDLPCNITKEKAVNNTRAGGLGGPSKAKAGAVTGMSIDDYLGHMERDEVLEVTPGSLRLCKKNSKALKGR